MTHDRSLSQVTFDARRNLDHNSGIERWVMSDRRHCDCGRFILSLLDDQQNRAGSILAAFRMTGGGFIAPKK
jgi:hypothetical protein